ncbi:NUDIX domain-containing protein [Actinomadura sp. ATCC 31491]|uniref:NUDIX domain-containing protein n=1 Tax=Actinomadura luzonensis TaxID=2805427 RepID=A0ABT0FX50_9ACTN|nr:NUDIX domain-containing protein [Actinomadura luzonensis]MCK2216923.1 NUDIX domain-containing protein [Actinomadura luzonensis]
MTSTERHDAEVREAVVREAVVREKVAWVLVRDHQVLMTRCHGREVFYFPGGMREPGESDAQTLVREIDEELRTAIDPATMVLFGTFEVPPDRPGRSAFRMICYTAGHQGPLTPAREIAEKAWLGYADRHRVSPVDSLVFQSLYDGGLLR